MVADVVISGQPILGVLIIVLVVLAILYIIRKI